MCGRCHSGLNALHLSLVLKLKCIGFFIITVRLKSLRTLTHVVDCRLALVRTPNNGEFQMYVSVSFIPSLLARVCWHKFAFSLNSGIIYIVFLTRASRKKLNNVSWLKKQCSCFDGTHTIRIMSSEQPLSCPTKVWRQTKSWCPKRNCDWTLSWRLCCDLVLTNGKKLFSVDSRRLTRIHSHCCKQSRHENVQDKESQKIRRAECLQVAAAAASINNGQRSKTNHASYCVVAAERHRWQWSLPLQAYVQTYISSLRH